MDLRTYCFFRRMEESPKLSVTRIRNDGKQWVDAHSTFLQGGEDLAKIEDEIDTSTTWELVEWDQAREEAARKMLENETSSISDEVKEKYEDEAAAQWDAFYTRNKQKFFKNRSYISKEYKDLSGDGSYKTKDGSQPVVLEIGCGVGNTLFPLLELNKDKYFHVFDCSQSAIEILKV
eukprot:TRINITY_DN1677_c0_g1_i7.p2 TRINITY_DN1677_c0_g1~~TRINITY_DN1677_c0_g1_i7.p2  ORF type:complete len:177 (+),score=33.17 TRINITY_DN1677_c0_g1_i7:827-1357(+)